MKKIIIKIHLCLGLTIGIILSLQGLTGALYVFQPELSRIIYSDLYRVERKGKLLELKELTASAENKFNDKITAIQFPERGMETFAFKLAQKKLWVFFDPYTGKYLGELFEQKGIFESIQNIHRTLAISEFGKYITASCAFSLAFIIVTSGIYLWSSKRNVNKKGNFFIRLGKGNKKFVFDLHSVTGFYVSIPLFFMALTGTYFTYPNFYEKLLNNFIPTEEVKKYSSEARSTIKEGTPPIDIYRAIEIMQSYYPGYNKRKLQMPSNEMGTINLTYINGTNLKGGERKRPLLFIDQYSEEIIYDYNPDRAEAGTRILTNWVNPIHLGEAGGTVTRILLFFAGLTPLLFLITGIKMWKYKREKKMQNLFRYLFRNSGNKKDDDEEIEKLSA
jgi:uncharacterized iron-regulated membrane protein